MSFLDPILNPLLNLNPMFILIIISFIVGLAITLFTKYFTDQVSLKKIRDEMKSNQKKLKEHKDNPQKLKQLQARTMSLSMKQMRITMKTSLYTIIPVLLLIGWLSSHLLFVPLTPGTPFSTSFNVESNGQVVLIAPEGITLESEALQQVLENTATWKLKGVEGDHLLEYKYNAGEGNTSYFQTIKITSEKEFAKQKITPEKGISMEINYEKLIVMNLFGWKLGWLGTYIIFSLIFSILLRKVLRVH